MKNHAPVAVKGPHRDPAKEHFWRRLLKDFAASRQSVREFCAARRLKESALYFWRAEIQRRDGQARAPRARSTPRPIAFTRVLVQPPQPAGAENGLRLRLKSGRELLLPGSWPLEQLAAMVRAIEDAA